MQHPVHLTGDEIECVWSGCGKKIPNTNKNNWFFYEGECPYCRIRQSLPYVELK